VYNSRTEVTDFVPVDEHTEIINVCKISKQTSLYMSCTTSSVGNNWEEFEEVPQRQHWYVIALQL
jgi:hypothetical protein